MRFPKLGHNLRCVSRSHSAVAARAASWPSVLPHISGCELLGSRLATPCQCSLSLREKVYGLILYVGSMLAATKDMGCAVS
jgi:hypothetical protein